MNTKTSKTQPEFIRKQYEFAAHLRDPENNPAPAEIEDRRMNIYRELFYNNIESFIANAFPVIRRIYIDAHWHKMVRNFFSLHQSHSPYFLEISQEFLSYLQNEHIKETYDPPFLMELAHYEWSELALTVLDRELDFTNIDTNADLLSGHPVISPLAWLLSYQWPVHQLSPDFQPQNPPADATHIFVYRDRKDKVRFINLNPVTARLMYLLQEDELLSGENALIQITNEMQHPKPDIVMNGGRQALNELKQSGVVLGVAK